MISPSVLWLSVAGVAFLVTSLFVVRKDIAAAHGLDKLIAMRFAFVASSLAVFAAEHLVFAQDLMQAVPPWMPYRLFWAYFVGFALLAAALSLTFQKQMRLSATLLAVMIFLFVLMIHVPNVLVHVRERIYWTIVFRESTFACGAFALAASQKPGWRPDQPDRLITVVRLTIGAALVFFGIQHFLFPAFAPGVPLSKLTPAWVPLPIVWAYLAGAILVIIGAALLANRYARTAAASLGLLMTLLTLFLYLPILLMARGTDQIVTGLNYVFDTLLFGGSVLLLAAALPAHAKNVLSQSAD
jgi:uncharacterized membrane protein